MSSRAKRALLLAGVAALVVLVGGKAIADFFADLTWFRALGFEDRYYRLEIAHAAGWIVVLAAAGSVLYPLIWSAARKAGPVRIRRRLGDLEISEALPVRWVKLGIGGAVALAALMIAAPVGSELGNRVLFLLSAPSWGRPDAILGHDPRTYLFVVPLLRTLWIVASGILAWAAIGLGLFLFVSGGVGVRQGKLVVVGHARRRLVWLGIAALLLLGTNFLLASFETVAGGPIDYVQAVAVIPAYRLLGILSILEAGALWMANRKRQWSLAMSGGVVLVVVWLLGLAVVPGVLQKIRVEPNELELERPYLQARIEATRAGFGLDDITEGRYGVTDSAPGLDKAERWTAGLPLWDRRPLTATYNQLQGLLAYHAFPDADADRYWRDGSPEQVAIGVREFDPGRLEASARTWQNLHLRYTHGQGAVVTPVDSATEGGDPAYYLSDLPPRPSPAAPDGVEMSEPRVYFGELTSQYVVEPRDSFPGELGSAGVPLGGVGRRLLFAWAFGSKNLLLRQMPGREQRLLWHRRAVERVRRLVPFLTVDPSPCPVLYRGHVVWLVDVYSTSDRYPLSEPFDLLGREPNYARNPVKAVVDGVTGAVRLYVVDASDPLLRTYRRAFPGLFAPLDSMPPGLRSHLRYPAALFRTQARALQAYHLRTAEAFYNKQGLWSFGREVYQDRPAPMDPYYLTMPMPGDSASPEFLLTIPFTPRDRDNLAAFLIARNDGAHYGELHLFDLPGDRQLFGPRQIEVQIDQDPRISQQLSLWRQLGSRATRGHLLLVPIDGFLLYVEPLFLEAEDREGAAPELKRVIAAAQGDVVMDETLTGSLRELLRLRAAAAAGEAAAPAEEEGPPGETVGRPSAGATGGEAREIPAGLHRLLQQADSALRAGDLARFGRLWERIRSYDSTAKPGADTAATSGRPSGDGE